MVTRWEDDWMHSGLRPSPEYVALSRLFVNDELKALVEFHGTRQQHFYKLSRFDGGSRTEVPGQFASIEEAKAAALSTITS